MNRSQNSKGFVLVAALSVAMLILLLGFAMSSMANANLRSSGNRLSRLEAKYAAESGVDIGMAQLQSLDAETARNFYAVPVSENCPTGTDCTITIQYVHSQSNGDVYRITSVGHGPRSAQYDSEALVLKGAGGTETNPWFALGLVSEGTVYINGTATIEDGGLHGNHGFSIHTGRFSADSVTASCPSDEIPARQCTCFAAGPGSREYCNGREPAHVVDPVDVGAVSNHLDELWQKYQAEPPDSVVIVSGPLVINNQAQLDDWAGKTIKVVGGDVEINVANGRLRDVNLILDGGHSVTVDSPLAVNGTNIWAQNLTFLGHSEVSDSSFYINDTLAFRGTNQSSNSVYLAGNIDFHGTSTVDSTKLLSDGDFDDHGAVTYSGETTLASRGDVTFHGATDLSALDNEDGLAVIAMGDITFSGRSDTTGVFWLGGNFRINGTKRIIGGVLSESDIDLNGRSYIKAHRVENDDLPQVELLDGVYVLSRGAVSED
ncbi:pilus assembly PilX family protein [Oceanithermus sp.]